MDPVSTAGNTPAQPTACLLHGDIHLMGPACWGTALDWYFTHQHIPEAEQRDDYQAAVERKMLDDLVRGAGLNRG